MKQGFVLLELMVYIGTSVILCMLVFGSALSLHRALLKNKTISGAEMMVATALERCMHDIRSAPIAGWKRVASDCIVWQQGDMDIGWMIQDATLQRISGRYDLHDATWHKSTLSKVAGNIKECRFAVDYGSNKSSVRGIAIAITSNAGPCMKSYVQLRNREIP